MSPPANEYLSKELPSLPQESDGRLKSNGMGEIMDPKGKLAVNSQHKSLVHAISRSPVSSKSHSFPHSVSRLAYESHRNHHRESNSAPRRPPPPPMTTSARKILQLTGFDPSLDLLPQSHYSVSSESADSGSQYSHSEYEDYGAIAATNPWESSSSKAPNQVEPSAENLRSEIYNLSINGKHSANASQLSPALIASAMAAASSLRTRDRRPPKADERIMEYQARENTVDSTSNRGFMILEKAQNERQRRARFTDDFRRDGDDRSRHNTTPASPTRMPYDGMTLASRIQTSPLPSLKTTRSFGSGKHPPKSPFPFTSNSEDLESREQGTKLRTKFVKRFSGRKKWPVKQTVIPNAQREVNGPDTPIPSSLGFPDILQKGSGHWQDAMGKAKRSLKIKTADEKRREQLKKQIFVIGITDQTPDGRVSEWL